MSRLQARCRLSSPGVPGRAAACSSEVIGHIRESRPSELDGVELRVGPGQDVELVARILGAIGYELLLEWSATHDQMRYRARRKAEDQSSASPGDSANLPNDERRADPPVIDDNVLVGYEHEGDLWESHASISVDEGAWWSGSLSIPARSPGVTSNPLLLRLKRHGTDPVHYRGTLEWDLAFPLPEIDLILSLLFELVSHARRQGMLPAGA